MLSPLAIHGVNGMPCTVVTVSRTTGADGEAVGKLVADQLGFTYVDNQIISKRPKAPAF